jgi:hypothetical protein
MNETVTLTAALFAGVMASGHCLGMCGPMTALAASRPGQPRATRAVLYNAGRLLSYALIGALFGGLGYAVGSAAGIAQWALVLRVGLGAVLLTIGARMLFQRRGASAFERVGARLWRRLAPLTGRLDPANRTRDLFAMGLLWGWLPCGIVYSMLAVAALSGGALPGAATMLAFGIGTLPSMLGLSLLGTGLGFLRTSTARRGLGAVLMLSGIWMAAMPLSHALSMKDAGAGMHHEHSMSHD